MSSEPLYRLLHHGHVLKCDAQLAHQDRAGRVRLSAISEEHHCGNECAYDHQGGQHKFYEVATWPDGSSGIYQNEEVVIFTAENAYGLIPTALLAFLWHRRSLNIADDSGNFPLKIALIVVTLKLLVDLSHIRQSPSGLGEVEHLPLNVR